jgi:hydroxymethylbilane synthase
MRWLQCFICALGMVDATLLALAGLKRLGMHDVISKAQIIGWDEMLPAVAQGAIGIQCRSDDERVLQYLSILNHPETKSAVDCERSFLACLDGNCRTPIAGQARMIDGQLHFRGMISKPDGSDMIQVEKVGSIEQAIQIGFDAGNEIKAIAGAKFVEYQQAVAEATSKSAATGSWSNLQS